jgi:diketogulonate reductase-like aldo/keto reductase
MSASTESTTKAAPSAGDETLAIASTLRLSSGYTVPLLGFGVYQNYDAKPSVLEAFKAGYRHVDSAQVYRNEREVGEALRASGLDRGEVFISTLICYETTRLGSWFPSYEMCKQDTRLRKHS